MPEEADLDFVTALFSRQELVAHRPNPIPDTPDESTLRLSRDRAHWHDHGFGRWAVMAGGRLIGFGGVTVSKEFDGL
ncbi:MAG: GNAT family N-acetyltransferase, partial [Rhizobiaceae bacterium]|nr:GNAT family N-acetyltransferase [Rhizobiaceae bacterium]